MAEFDTSSYPKPQAPGNPLDMLTKVGGLVDTLGNIEAGKAVQGAIGPDGEIDRNALAQSLKSTVAGSTKALPTLNAYETLRQAGHVADQAGYENFRKRMELVNGFMGHLASKDNPTINDVNSIAASILDPKLGAHKYGLTFPVIMNAIQRFRGPDGRPLPPAEIRKRALEIQTMTAHTMEQMQINAPRTTERDTGVDVRNVPIGTMINPKSVATVKRIPVGAEQTDNDPASPTYGQRVLTPSQPPAPDVPLPRAAPAGRDNALSGLTRQPAAAAPAEPTFDDIYKSRISGAAPAAGLPPGQSEAMQSTAQDSARMGNQLIAAAAEAPITRGILDNLEKDLKNFTSGPGADWKRVGKAFVNANLPQSVVDKIGFDPKSIANQEGFNKLAYNLAQSQFQALGGTGTDAKLNSTMSTSPNELISREGNVGIIRLLKGNNDALNAKAKAWNAWKKVHGPATFSDFQEHFNENFNPRVFQIKYIPSAQRTEWYNAMSEDEQRSFAKAAKYAKKQGWVKKDDL